VQGVGGVPITINARGSANELIGPDRTNLWVLSGADSGTLDGVIRFNDVQNLVGGTIRDTFTYAPTGSLSGSMTGEAPVSLATVAGFNQASATVRATIALSAGQSVALLARYDAGTNSTYGAELVSTANGFVPIIYREDHGVRTVLATGSAIASATGALAFKVNGSALELELNNSPLLSTTDTVLTSGGAAVLFSAGVSVSAFGAS
jgi:hypothetical protein